MPITAKITRESLENTPEVKIQYVPASIDGNGAIKTDEYFNNYTEEANGGLFVNSLRGFPLKGVEMGLPESIQGIVCRESEQLQIDEAERDLKIGGKFNRFIYWNYDKNPSENDPYKKALHWLKSAEALHSEVTSIEEEEDISVKKETIIS